MNIQIILKLKFLIIYDRKGISILLKNEEIENGGNIFNSSKKPFCLKKSNKYFVDWYFKPKLNNLRI